MDSVTATAKRVSHSPRRATISNVAEAKREDNVRLKDRAEKLSEALDKLVTSHGRSPHQSSIDLAALGMPCFFHRRFDDAVDIEKILQDVAEDESLSHSALMQTATGIREVSKQLQRRQIKKAVRNVLIVTKARDNQLVYLTRDLAEWLLRTPRYGSRLGVNVYVDQKLQRSRRFDAAGLVSREPRFEQALRYWTPEMCCNNPEIFDLVLTLGGDGTVLHTSWLFQRIVPPVLSFSLGSLGFLTTFDFHSFREHLNFVMGGLGNHDGLSSPVTLAAGPATPISASASAIDSFAGAGMSVNLRMRFTCTVHRAPPRRKKGSSLSSTRSSPGPPPLTKSANPLRIHQALDEQKIQYEVLNEIVIDRGPSPYVSNLELYSMDDDGTETLVTVIQADGVIFSTPTGSTAYSLSAGGSLVHPDIPAILLTPICPHTLSFRPMLLNDSMALRVAVPKQSRATAYCSFDGKSRIELRQGDYVAISASRYPFPMVKKGKMEWLDSVSRTLRWNTREATQKGWSGKGKSGRVSAGKSARSNSHRLKSTALEEDYVATDSDNSDIAITDEDDNGYESDKEDSEEQFDIDIENSQKGVLGKDLIYANNNHSKSATLLNGNGYGLSLGSGNGNSVGLNGSVNPRGRDHTN